MKNEYTLDNLGDIGAEVYAVSKEIDTVSTLVVGGSFPKEGIEAALYAITLHLERISKTISNLELQYFEIKGKTA